MGLIVDFVTHERSCESDEKGPVTDFLIKP